MADLSTLDITAPPDTQAISAGALRIRETRVATVTSFDVEHDLAGRHTFPRGTTAARPAVGKAGSIYFNTDSNLLELDDGSVWRMVHTTIPSTIASNQITLTLASQSVQTLVVAAPQDSRLLMVAQGVLANPTLGGLNAAQWGLYLDGVLQDPPGFIFGTENSSESRSYYISAITNNLAQAFHTVQVKGLLSAGVSTPALTLSASIMVLAL